MFPSLCSLGWAFKISTESFEEWWTKRKRTATTAFKKARFHFRRLSKIYPTGTLYCFLGSGFCLSFIFATTAFIIASLLPFWARLVMFLLRTVVIHVRLTLDHWCVYNMVNALSFLSVSFCLNLNHRLKRFYACDGFPTHPTFIFLPSRILLFELHWVKQTGERHRRYYINFSISIILWKSLNLMSVAWVNLWFLLLIQMMYK